MGEAILSRLLSTHTYSPDRIIVSHPRSERRDYLQSQYGVVVVAENWQVECDILLLAIKPQQLFDLEVTSEVDQISCNLLVSILAGCSLERLADAFSTKLPIVRAMPNTPAQVGAGMTCFACNDLVTEDHKQRVKNIFLAVGEVLEVPEYWMDAVTGLSGSGPGYMAVVIEALIDGAVMMGLPRSVAQTLAVQTVLGSAQYLQTTGIDPALLKNKVTSPGGTTIAGIHALERHGLRLALMEAVKAATLRSEELDR